MILRCLILEFKFDGFSIETCRSMVAMMDFDHSGKLGFDEFRVLWDSLREWKGIFKKYDTDKSGSFSSYELRKALQNTGEWRVFFCYSAVQPNGPP